MTKVLISLFFLMLFLILGCGSPDISQGTSTTAGNPFVAITVSYSDEPLENANIFIMKTDSIYEGNGENSTLKSDKSGEFSTEIPDSGKYRLTILSEDGSSALIHDFALQNGDSLDLELVTVPLTTLQFDSSHESVTIAGTPFRAGYNGTIALPVGKIPAIVALDTTGMIMDTLAISLTLSDVDTFVVTDRLIWRSVMDSNKLAELDTVSAVSCRSNGEVIAIGGDRLVHKKKDGTFTTEQFIGRTLNSIASLNNNEMWIGTDSGLIIVDEEYTFFSTQNHVDLNSDTIYTVSSIGNTLFVAAKHSFFHVQNSRWTAISYPDDLVVAVTMMEALTDSVVLFATDGEGIWRLDLTNETHWSHFSMVELGLESETATGMAAMDGSRTWLVDTKGTLIWELDVSADINHWSKSLKIHDVAYNKPSGTLFLLEGTGLYLWDFITGWNASIITDIPGLSEKSVISNARGREVVIASVDGISSVQVAR